MTELSKGGFFERRFRLSERKTDVKTEFLAGLTTFMTMSYILAVNPNMLAQTGMDKGGVFTATIVASVFAMLVMGFYANLPFALAPGMGLNAFFTYTVVLDRGHSWQFALTAVFIEGIIFILMSFFNVREAIFNAIPMSLKKAVSVGIGLFIALIGFVNAGVISSGAGTILSLGNLLTPGVLVTFVGLLVMALLMAKKVKGALLYGIIISTVLALILGVTHAPENGWIQAPPSLSGVAFKLEWKQIFTWDMFAITFTFLFVDLFDTVGTLVGVASKADLLNEKGELPKAGPALFADSVGTTVGALLGTSTVTTFVESASGVTDGGRTGLTSLSVAFFFLISLFLFPLFSIVPAQATAPALIMVGLFMMTPIKDIPFEDYTESVPAFLTIVMMPFAYSIAEGIAFGMMSYVLIKGISGKHKDVSLLMYILAFIFLARIIAPVFGM